MVPASIIILAIGIIALALWIEDRRELRRVKRDVARALARIEKLEAVVAGK